MARATVSGREIARLTAELERLTDEVRRLAEHNERLARAGRWWRWTSLAVGVVLVGLLLQHEPLGSLAVYHLLSSGPVKLDRSAAAMAGH